MASDHVVANWPELLETGHGVVIVVHVQPGASRDEVVGPHGGACKVRVVAPPRAGKANTAVEDLLAAAFELPRASVEVVAGASGRRKRVRLGSIALREAERRLATLYQA